jgi:2-iminobutanoate/2-iminopropanoate deaminase
MKEEIRTEGSVKTDTYSQGILAGDLLFTSSQVPRDPVTGLIPEGGIDAQTRQVLRNMSAVLEAAGCSLNDVVKTTVHLANLADFDAYNLAYCDVFPEPRPARTTVGAELGGILVEIDAIAVRPVTASKQWLRPSSTSGR